MSRDDLLGDWSMQCVTETRMWGSYEKVMVIRRATAEEGKR